MDIYLDIDGVLLANESNLANYAKEFLVYVITNYPDSTFWLTTHCQGDADTPIKRLWHMFDDKTITLMEKIKPTTWDIAKTEAIDFTKPFLWFDDDCFDDERRELVSRGLLNNWIEVDLRKDVNALYKFIESFPVPINYPQK